VRVRFRCFGLAPGQVESWVSALSDSAGTGLVEALRVASNFAARFLATEVIGIHGICALLLVNQDIHVLVTCAAAMFPWSTQAVHAAVASCSAGGVGCSIVAGDAAKFVPLVGSFAGAGATFASVRWIGTSVTDAAAAASEEIYTILKFHRLRAPKSDSRENWARPIRSS